MAKSCKKKKRSDKKQEIAKHAGIAAAVGDAPQLTALIFGEVAVGLSRVVEDLTNCQGKAAAGEKKEWLRARPVRLEEGEDGQQRCQGQCEIGKHQGWGGAIGFHRCLMG